MKIKYIQGILSGEIDTTFNIPSFLRKSGNYVDIFVKSKELVVSISDENRNYIVKEQFLSQKAFGPFSSNKDYLLFLDVDVVTGKISKQISTTQIKYLPNSYTAACGDMWFDTINKKMYEWNGSNWKHVIRIVIGKLLSNGQLIHELFQSQVEQNTESVGGYILYGQNGYGIKTSDDKFLTTDKILTLQSSGIDYPINPEVDIINVEATEVIPAYSFVGVSGDNKICLADISKQIPAIGFVTKNLVIGDTTRLYIDSIIKNENWSFSSVDLGSIVWLDNNGQFTTRQPMSSKQIVGQIIFSNCIKINIKPEVLLTGISGVVIGKRGEQGKDGAPGKDGLHGKDGSHGKPGRDAIGIPGKDGAPGKDGRDGVGLPGRDGVPGKDGLPGRDGIGLPGRPGKDGVKGDKGDSGMFIPKALKIPSKQNIILNWTNYNEIRLDVNRQMTITDIIGGLDGQRYILKLKQISPGGTINISASNIRYRSGLSSAQISLSSGTNIVDRIEFLFDKEDNKYDILNFYKGFQ